MKITKENLKDLGWIGFAVAAGGWVWDHVNMRKMIDKVHTINLHLQNKYKDLKNNKK